MVPDLQWHDLAWHEGGKHSVPPLTHRGVSYVLITHDESGATGPEFRSGAPLTSWVAWGTSPSVYLSFFIMWDYEVTFLTAGVVRFQRESTKGPPRT